jgi:hypothetical protein
VVTPQFRRAGGGVDGGSFLIGFPFGDKHESRNLYVVGERSGYWNFAAVQHIAKPRADDWSNTLTFRKVYSTQEAISRVGNEYDSKGNAGKRTLAAIIAEDAQNKTRRYHRGDKPYTCDIRQVQGVVRCAPVPIDGNFPSYVGQPYSECIWMGAPVSERSPPSGEDEQYSGASIKDEKPGPTPPCKELSSSFKRMRAGSWASVEAMGMAMIGREER